MNWPPRACAIGQAIGAAMWLLALVVGWAFVVAMAGGCGAATTGTAAASCSALLVAIGESRVEPVRAEADRQVVTEVCARYAVPQDGGAE